MTSSSLVAPGRLRVRKVSTRLPTGNGWATSPPNTCFPAQAFERAVVPTCHPARIIRGGDFRPKPALVQLMRFVMIDLGTLCLGRE